MDVYLINEPIYESWVFDLRFKVYQYRVFNILFSIYDSRYLESADRAKRRRRFGLLCSLDKNYNHSICHFNL